METLLAAALVPLAKKMLDFVRYIITMIDPPPPSKNIPFPRRRALRSMITLFTGWVIGVVVVLMAVHTAFADLADGLFSIPINDINLWTQLMLGMVVGSSTGVISDFTRALDNTQSAQEPPLTGGSLSDVPAEVEQSGS